MSLQNMAPSNIRSSRAAVWFTLLVVATAPAQGPGPFTLPGSIPAAGPGMPGGSAEVESETGQQKLISLKFSAAPLAQVLQFYSELTGRTLLEAPSVNATINLRSHTKLTVEESLQAIKTVLAMNNVGLVHVGEKFVKVVPIASVLQEGLAIQTNAWARRTRPDTDDLVSEIISLRYIDTADAQKAIAGLQHGYGKIQPLERINSLLVADSAANINRMQIILEQIDQPLELKEKLHVLPIRHTKASDVKAKIEEIIAEAKDKERAPTVRRPRESGAPGVEAAPPPIPGIIRAPRPVVARPETTPETSAAEPEDGRLIRGNVRMVADDRTGILIVITRPENLPFFEDMVAALDVPTAPDVIVRVLRLEYADSEDVAGMLNNLIGAASSKDAAPRKAATPGAAGESPPRGAELEQFLQQQREAGAPRETKTKVGQLSADNIKILPDKRSNALIIMASKGDMATLEEIIRDMDIMLSQVLIEAVILQVNLGDTMERGVDLIQRSLIAYDRKGSRRDPVFAFAGSTGDSASPNPTDATSFRGAFLPEGGLTYYFTHFGLNIDAVLRWAATDSKTRVLSSPVVLTTDNKEAKIDVSKEIYFYKGQTPTSVGGTIAYVPNVESRKVGINLTVTPRINKKKFVVMEIKQKIEEQADSQPIQGQGDWPTISSREFTASVAVRTGETIVLGGLVKNSAVDTNKRVPILGDIPLLGIPFRASSRQKGREEVVVFITPYVLDTPEDIAQESQRRKDAIDAKNMWTQGWSDSRLADPPVKKGPLRRWWQRLAP